MEIGFSWCLTSKFIIFHNSSPIEISFLSYSHEFHCVIGLKEYVIENNKQVIHLKLIYQYIFIL